MEAPSPRDLADSVQARLPRELRDIVYAYLWDAEILEALDYSRLLACRDKKCEFTEDEEGNSVCLCDTPAHVPEFARAVFVGFAFAQEAVEWLYDKYEGFTLNSPGEVLPFYTRDTFHIGLTPMGYQLRRLTLVLDLAHPRAEEYRESLDFKLSPLLRLKIRPGARLKIHVASYPTDSRDHYRELYDVAMLLEALESVAAKLTSNNIAVDIDYALPGVGVMDVSHMLGPATYAFWKHFIHTDYANVLRQAPDTGFSNPHVDGRIRYMGRIFRLASTPRGLGSVGRAIRSAKRR